MNIRDFLGMGSRMIGEGLVDTAMNVGAGLGMKAVQEIGKDVLSIFGGPPAAGGCGSGAPASQPAQTTYPQNPVAPLLTVMGLNIDPKALVGPLQERAGNLETLIKYFDTAETAGAFFNGMQDGLMTLGDLQTLVNNPTISGEVKQAAQYFLDHPESFNALGTDSSPFGPGFVTGMITKADLMRGLDATKAALLDYQGLAKGPKLDPAQASPAQQQVAPARQPLIDDPDTNGVQQGGKGGAADDLTALDDAQTEPIKDTIKDAIKPTKTWKYDSKKSPEENLADRVGKAFEDHDKLLKDALADGTIDSTESYKLQDQMQKAQLMFQTLTNMSRTFHEMAMNAINHIR